MLNDKHIEQWSSYLIEDLPNSRELLNDRGLEKILISMYKKGYEDAVQDHNDKIMFGDNK